MQGLDRSYLIWQDVENRASVTQRKMEVVRIRDQERERKEKERDLLPYFSSKRSLASW